MGEEINHQRRRFQGGVGHNLPQEAPEAFARAVIEVDEGGDFAAREQPELFAAEPRAAFRSLRPAH